MWIDPDLLRHCVDQRQGLNENDRLWSHVCRPVHHVLCVCSRRSVDHAVWHRTRRFFRFLDLLHSFQQQDEQQRTQTTRTAPPYGCHRDVQWLHTLGIGGGRSAVHVRWMEWVGAPPIYLSATTPNVFFPAQQWGCCYNCAVFSCWCSKRIFDLLFGRVLSMYNWDKECPPICLFVLCGVSCQCDTGLYVHESQENGSVPHLPCPGVAFSVCSGVVCIVVVVFWASGKSTGSNSRGRRGRRSRNRSRSKNRRRGDQKNRLTNFWLSSLCHSPGGVCVHCRRYIEQQLHSPQTCMH